MSLQFTTLPVEDFSGGITDYVLNAPPNKAEEMDNFLINPNKKAVQRPGSQVYDANMYQIPDGVQRIGALIDTTDSLFIQSARKVWYPNSTVFTELVGPTSNPVFSAGTTSSYISWSEWNGHIYAVSDSYASPMKIYKNSSGIPVVRNAGLPSLASSPTVTAGGAGSNSYVYAFLYYYTYTLGTGLVVFEDFGPITQVGLSSAAAPNASAVSIAAIPALSNGSTENRDTTAIKVKIYRTVAGGNTFYYVGQVTNGTAIFSDNVSDATLQANNNLLYTTGGIVENDPPPACKYVHVVNGYAYYGYCKQGSQTLANRVRQSLRDDPDSAPEDFFIDMKDDVMGISSFNNNPIVFGVSKVYRLDGAFDDLGQGDVTYEEISKTTGCISARSIVQTREGVFFAGIDGFYWTNGFEVKKISDSLNETYKTITSSATKKERIYGKYDPFESRVYWAVQLDSSSSDNDTLFVLDLRWGVRADSTFTTWSDATGNGGFAPTCIAYYNNQIIRADRRGYLFKHDKSYTTDPKVDTALTPSQWTTQAIIYDYRSTHLDFSMPQTRKWATRMLLTADNTSTLSIQIESYNDLNTNGKQLKEIRSRDNIGWGDATIIWGTDSFIWAATDLVEQWRRFPINSLRFSRKQIRVTNSFTNVYRSDDFTTCDVNSSAKTATMNGTTFEWPLDSVDYYITFDTDNYTNEYKITNVTTSVVTFSDVSNLSVTGSTKKWLIRGYAKGEVFNLQSYVIFYAPLTPYTFKTYQSTTEDGGNA